VKRPVCMEVLGSSFRQITAVWLRESCVRFPMLLSSLAVVLSPTICGILQNYSDLVNGILDARDTQDL
jgi:hypothetical protein